MNLAVAGYGQYGYEDYYPPATYPQAAEPPVEPAPTSGPTAAMQTTVAPFPSASLVDPTTEHAAAIKPVITAAATANPPEPPPAPSDSVPQQAAPPAPAAADHEGTPAAAPAPAAEPPEQLNEIQQRLADILRQKQEEQGKDKPPVQPVKSKPSVFTKLRGAKLAMASSGTLPRSESFNQPSKPSTAAAAGIAEPKRGLSISAPNSLGGNHAAARELARASSPGVEVASPPRGTGPAGGGHRPSSPQGRGYQGVQGREPLRPLGENQRGGRSYRRKYGSMSPERARPVSCSPSPSRSPPAGMQRHSRSPLARGQRGSSLGGPPRGYHGAVSPEGRGRRPWTRSRSPALSRSRSHSQSYSRSPPRSVSPMSPRGAGSYWRGRGRGGGGGYRGRLGSGSPPPPHDLSPGGHRARHRRVSDDVDLYNHHDRRSGYRGGRGYQGNSYHDRRYGDDRYYDSRYAGPRGRAADRIDTSDRYQPDDSADLLPAAKDTDRPRDRDVSPSGPKTSTMSAGMNGKRLPGGQAAGPAATAAAAIAAAAKFAEEFDNIDRIDIGAALFGNDADKTAASSKTVAHAAAAILPAAAAVLPTVKTAGSIQEIDLNKLQPDNYYAAMAANKKHAAKEAVPSATAASKQADVPRNAIKGTVAAVGAAAAGVFPVSQWAASHLSGEGAGPTTNASAAGAGDHDADDVLEIVPGKATGGGGRAPSMSPQEEDAQSASEGEGGGLCGVIAM